MWSGIAVLMTGLTLAFAVPSKACCQGETKPAPACAEVNFTDERDDVANSGLDLVAAFLSAEGDEVHANVVVDHLDGSVGDGDTESGYYAVEYYDDSGAFRTAEARLNENGNRTGATWFDGPDGIVRVELENLDPATYTKFAVTTGSDYSDSRVSLGSPLSETLGHSSNVRPFGKDVDQIKPKATKAKCTKPAPPPPSATQPAPPAGEPPAEPAPRVTIGTPLRARGKTLRVPLRSTARVTDLRGRLTRDGRVVARGRLAALDGKGVLVLTARRTISRGVYLLTIPGVAERMRLRIG